jgi:hypothetical protein
MYRKAYRNVDSGAPSGPDLPWQVLALIGIVGALVLALPALVIGIVLHRLTRGWPGSVLVWLALTVLGAILLYVLSRHGLERFVLTQLVDSVQNVKRYHADFARWNLGLLWSETWPVWLRTLALTPIIALWCCLARLQPGIGVAFLTRQEHERQHAVSRAKDNAIRRAQRRLPDAVRGQMVIGVPIEDEHAQ